jgi:uncharacterized protein YndB with AHSA1/START domain
MPPLVSTIEVARPPAEVYAYATDPHRFREWQRDVVEVHMQNGDPLTPGSRFTTKRRFAGTTNTTLQEVIAVDEPRHWSVRGVEGPVRPSATITVEPLDDGTRSRVTFALDFDGPGVLVAIVRKQAARGAPISYRNFKERLET